MTKQKCKRRPICAYILLIVLLAFTGCTVNHKDGSASTKDPQQETEEIIDDGQLYILLCTDTEHTSIFLESAETGKQEKFEYEDTTVFQDRNGESRSVDQLLAGELLQVVYRKEEALTEKNRLTKVLAAEDTFEYRDITGFVLEPEKQSITVDGRQYVYDEHLIIFSDKGTIPLNELSELDTVCVRGRGDQILTLVVTGSHEAEEKAAEPQE